MTTQNAAAVACLMFTGANAFTRRPFPLRRFTGSTSSLFTRTILDRNNDEHDNEIDDDSRDWQYVLHLAEDAARRAGEIMRQTTGRIAVSKNKANVRDIVTDADVACQQVVWSTINAVFPNDAFLGEEDVDSGSQASMNALQQALTSNENDEEQGKLLWIVDPIDGTTNFQNGLPLFCCSIGVVAWNETTLEPELKVGVIYNPLLDEMTCGVAGRGAYLNGQRIVHGTNETPPPPTTLPLNESVINVGFPVVKESTLQASAKAVAALATRVRGLRMIACASQVVAWVARNQLQCYVSWDLNAWDVSAGMLIVQESGGIVLDLDGNEATITSRDLIFTSPNAGEALAREVLQVLDENDCLTYED